MYPTVLIDPRQQPQVGNVQSFQESDWAQNIQLAQQAGIDGFALNIGGENIDTSTYTQPQLDNAYNAAQGTGFKLFISFDYAANPSFDIPTVSGLINTYKGKDAQYDYGTRPMASTFEGPGNAGDWSTIKSNTGAFFCPDYTSEKGQASYFANADCALSWDVWPVGANGTAAPTQSFEPSISVLTCSTDMTDSIDTAWQSFLGSKPYMMGISPWFYSNLPSLGKTWTWRGKELFNERWQAAQQLQPQLVEIITWNDFGESHYIGPLNAAEEYPGSSAWVDGMPHDAYRLLLPAYIAAYKGTNGSSTHYAEDLVYAHKINPAANQGDCSAGDVVGNAPYQAPVSAAAVSTDAIDVYLLVNSPADLSVSIGGGAAQPVGTANVAGVNYFSVPTNGATGAVAYTVTRNGDAIMSFTGATISGDCSAAGGQINFNAITGSYSESGASSRK